MYSYVVNTESKDVALLIENAFDCEEIVICQNCRFWSPEKKECNHNNRKDTMFAYDFCSSGMPKIEADKEKAEKKDEQI